MPITQLDNILGLSLEAAELRPPRFTEPAMPAEENEQGAPAGASPGSMGSGFRLESVTGPDDRTRLSPTTGPGMRAIAQLTIVPVAGEPWTGTGWFIGPRTVVTAAHVLFRRLQGGGAVPVSHAMIAPGRDGQVLPFGVVSASQFVCPPQFLATGDDAFDYAAILLPQPVPQAGSFGIGPFSEQQILSSQIAVAGYPDPVPNKPGAAPMTLWVHTHAPSGVGATFIQYENDTTDGQSGAPLIIKTPSGFWSAGIHTGSNGLNAAVRIVGAVFNDLMRWRA